MKKAYLTILMALVALVGFAANPLSLKEGNKKFFKTASGSAFFEVIYKGASFDDKMPLEKKYDDMDNKTKVSYEGFVEEFIEHSKNVSIVKKLEEANYKFTVLVTKVDQFTNIMGFIPGPCIRVWGTFTITDAKTGEKLLVVDIDEIDGGSAPTPDRAFNDTFGELAKKILKFK